MILIARPRLINQGPLRVIRGGSWRDFGQFCRSAYLHRFEPMVQINSLGFRIVMRKDLPCDNTR